MASDVNLCLNYKSPVGNTQEDDDGAPHCFKCAITGQPLVNLVVELTQKKAKFRILSEVRKLLFLGFADGLETVGDKRPGKGFTNGIWVLLLSRGHFEGSKLGSGRRAKGQLRCQI